MPSIPIAFTLWLLSWTHPANSFEANTRPCASVGTCTDIDLYDWGLACKAVRVNATGTAEGLKKYRCFDCSADKLTAECGKASTQEAIKQACLDIPLENRDNACELLDKGTFNASMLSMILKHDVNVDCSPDRVVQTCDGKLPQLPDSFETTAFRPCTSLGTCADIDLYDWGLACKAVRVNATGTAEGLKKYRCFDCPADKLTAECGKASTQEAIKQACLDIPLENRDNACELLDKGTFNATMLSMILKHDVNVDCSPDRVVKTCDGKLPQLAFTIV